MNINILRRLFHRKYKITMYSPYLLCETTRYASSEKKALRIARDEGRSGQVEIYKRSQSGTWEPLY